MIAEYVYVISSPDAVKVGKAVNPQSRIKTLRTANSGRLYLDHSVKCDEGQAYSVEKCAQRLLEDKVIGGEWFAVSPSEALAAIYKAIDLVRQRNAKRAMLRPWSMKRKNRRVVVRTFRNGWAWMKDAAA